VPIAELEVLKVLNKGFGATMLAVPPLEALRPLPAAAPRLAPGRRRLQGGVIVGNVPAAGGVIVGNVPGSAGAGVAGAGIPGAAGDPRVQVKMELQVEMAIPTTSTAMMRSKTRAP